jgi:pimeloyl-ACP methyl ester carboxylesterase
MKLLLLLLIFGFHAAALANSECVVLLHGWGQATNAMDKLDKTLGRAGFKVVNSKYSTRRNPIEVLAKDTIEANVIKCRQAATKTIHFVTHSMGGILLRYYLEQEEIDDLGKVVMLGPPNKGADLVDYLDFIPGFKFLSGPTGAKLGTDKDSIPNLLGPVNFNLGVIAGNTNINPLKYLFNRGLSDSVVSVENTRIEGMNAHIVLPVTHQLMMRNDEVIDHAIHYLKTGSFMPWVY